MTVFNSAHRATRFISVTALGFGLVLGAVACGDDQATDAAAKGGPAPVVGNTDNRLQLTEGVNYKMHMNADDTRSVQLTAQKDGDEPTVVINVSEGGGEEQEHTLSLGETLDLGDGVWRVSEIGMSDSEAQPGSATLIRDES
ncbi:DUF6406 domain-containing protein [Allosalinactinospora lopnorensis]|uniref:DUF6406 domain-containing protein n=1 Tax=Allosalinactinospora lopnorensis TaxID=1352348 RepID=UPI000695A9AB|nr:DUF6406 domain-containing protein [Allosalinactinospora lopnorensis]